MNTNIKIAQKLIDHIIKNKTNELDLSNLNLTDDDFRRLKRIDKLINLRKILLAHNYLSDIPPKLYVLERITFIDISHNELVTLNNKISCFKRLKILRILRNNLKVFPKAILKFEHLEELSLAENRIQTIPETISENGQIVSEGIQSLKKLQVLFINNNDIKSLPTDFKYMNKLNALFVFNNPVSISCNGICEFVGRQNITDYYNLHKKVSEIRKYLLDYQITENWDTRKIISLKLQKLFEELMIEQENKFHRYNLTRREIFLIPYLAFKIDPKTIFMIIELNSNAINKNRKMIADKMKIRTTDVSTKCYKMLTTR